MGRPFRISASKRSFYHLRYRLALVLFITFLFEQHYLFFVYRDGLAAKYSPTEFEPAFISEHRQPWTPDEESAHFQDRVIADRAAWRTLGKGWEGETFVYQDSVIKTFKPGRSPFRNCAPGTAEETWPTEIPASLHFGGTESNTISSYDGFLPVKAYFMANSSTAQAEWHLVTPLLKEGTLEDLVVKIRKERRTYRDIDTHNRRAFEHLLTNLRKLHKAGYCHDDVKPANIFVADETHWILGDLGNLRHVSHPYHSSLIWSENKQLEDCRANDNMRALKSYIRFVRDSGIDGDVFDIDFFKGREALSRLYWSAAADPAHLTAVDLRTRSATLYTQLDADTTFEYNTLVQKPSFAWLIIGSLRWVRHYAVNRALETRMGDKLARWWALTWLFGVPMTNVCGV